MKKEDLILKWLDNDQLTKQESEAFEQLSAYDSYVKISEAAEKFRAPNYDVSDNLEILTKKITTRKKPVSKTSYPKTLARIAAILIVGIGLYFSFFNDQAITISTIASEKSTVKLPDESIVKLNALSSVIYNQSDWENQRIVTLDGEAHFKVAKGKKFDVHTSSGIVSVIGTEFNIKQRSDFFEVICYEGVVSVTIDKQTKYLKAGDVIEVVSEKFIEKKTNRSKPDWHQNKSFFQKTPYEKVLKELEWQYGVQVRTKNIDRAKLYTGNFVHSDIHSALKSITIPMRLKFVIDNKTVTLYKE